MNDGLAHGRYFFMDIARDGIALYQSDDSELLEPRPKTPEQALELAKEYFEEWFPSAMKRYELFKYGVEKGFWKDAAFDLHQTTERLYHCALLVVNFYTPHSHNIAFLRNQAEKLDRRLVNVWPSDSRADRAKFTKLKDAYVKARYSKHYRVSAEELEWLGLCVEQLGQIVQTVCAERIRELSGKIAT
ncbi:HEPN domain-containing protein [Sphingomonas sp. NIBR02145]|uniref:HEPN domain-containing protein n=1 Tax=Sphingomonas sp. NIBR02145 TaxID=3014784 RepID=UPI0022B36B70|nr:HEPN domain-containing protein [Sphingomonas sp. NIBR02145]WHU04272.1 HEPN domain-containing protein [Sphingomonas sp. NIBR02145]